MPIKIVTDSTAYIPSSIREELGISSVSLSVNFGTQTYREEDLDYASFYEKMAQSREIPTSSQPAPEEMYRTFERHVTAGDAVAGIFISSDMSGTYAGALTAGKKIKEKYPSAVVEVVDSRSNCMELGFAVLAAARAAGAGLSMEQVLEQARRVIQRSRFLFVPQTLEYLRKGGRIGGAAALVGSILQIKPILTVVDGKTAVLEKVRSKSQAVQNILNVVFEDIKHKGLGDIVVHHISCEPEGRSIAKLLESKLDRAVPVYPIGPVIGLHVGPGTIGIAYYTAEKR
ncbi:MAG: DegV family protein [Bacillota bacterium]